MSREYLCTLRPLGEYFLGGERTFRFGDASEQEGKIDYYIKSETMPTQTTLLGALRFLVLEKARQLSNSHRDTSKQEEQKKWVGESGFIVGKRDEKADYGAVEELGPLFLLTDEGHRLIPTPLNKTKREEKSYRPFQSMIRCRTELGVDSLLPSTEDYEAKAGLPDSFLDLEDGSLTKCSDIFQEKEHTRVKKMSDNRGLFKKVCKTLFTGKQGNGDEPDVPGYKFAFYCRAREDALPERAVAYVGQDKSAFAFEARPVEDGKGNVALLEKIGRLPKGDADAAVFYAVSDAFADIDEETRKQLLFYVLKKRPFRNMMAGAIEGNYRDSMKKSPLYQMIRAGSVFYVRPECRDAFMELMEAEGARQIGLNVIVEMGGK